MNAGYTRLCFTAVFIIFCFNRASAQLKADFTSNTTSGCAPLVVAFQNLSTGNAAAYQWDLGNGTKSTLKDPVATYFDAGTYTVTLTITDSKTTATVTKKNYIIVYAKPTADFDISNTSGCYPLNVSMKDKSKSGSGTIASRLWDFGDGSLSTEQSPVHTYSNAGTFDVTLSVTNSNGCVNLLTKNDVIVIEGGVLAGFGIASLNICKSPASVSFINKSSGLGDLIYSWKFGDGQTSTEVSPAHSYVNQGNYTVQLTAKTQAGCTDTASLPVSVTFPKSSFITSASTCTNQSIQFTNNSSPLPVSVIWSFGDGTTSTQLNPSKAYAQAGTYKVKLVNFFSESCKDSVTQTISVGAGIAPMFITADTFSCAPPYTVHFTNKTTGTVKKYRWDFGDGAIDSSVNPVHVYKSYGNFSVKLTAVSANGCETEFKKDSYIDVEAVKITGFKNLPDSGCTPLAVSPIAVFNKPDKILKYTWYFGDGATSTLVNPTHTYTKDGFYDVKLVVLTTGGCTDSLIYKNAVLVGHKLHTDFTVQHDHICANQTAELTNTTPDGPIHFVRWDFGAVEPAEQNNIHHYEPTDTGWVTAALVTYNYGCPDTLIKPKALYVHPPVALMTAINNCNNKLSVSLGDSSIGDITRLWTFGDGKSDTTRNPAHQYNVPGNYLVTLQARNGECADTITKTVQVINEKGQLNISAGKLCHGTALNAAITGVDSLNIKNTRWDFGEGGAVILPGIRTTYTYQASGNYMLNATMTDKNGCEYNFKSPDSIHVYGPVARLSSAKTGYCQNDVASFNEQSTTDGIHAITGYTWDYGDSTIMKYKAAPFAHPYTDTGYFTVKLTVADSYGCTDSMKRINYIYVGHPYAKFTISDSVACPNSVIKFTNKSTGKNLQYRWLFGDKDSSGSATPQHIYSIPGSYTPQLFITDENGCTSYYKLPYPITVSDPKARFAVSDSFATCPPLQVNFTNSSTNYNSYSWSFGDGGNSTLNSPSHIYTYPGDYVTRLVTNGYGSCADTLVKHIIIKGPTGEFSYDSTPVCYPAATVLNVQSVTSTSFLWDYADGNTQSTVSKQTTHNYEPGFYVPKIILSNAAGCKVPIKGKDTIRIFSVAAAAKAATTFACDAHPFTFTDASTTNDKMANCYWNFGDSVSAQGSAVSHGYKATGAYWVKMIAETIHGCRDTFSMAQPLRAIPSPSINLTGDSTGCVKSQLNFVAVNNTTDTSAIKYVWNFGAANAEGPDHGSNTFTKGGVYKANVLAVNSSGCSDSSFLMVNIHELPIIKIKTDTIVCQNSASQLVVSGGLTYKWNSAQSLSCADCATTLANPQASASYAVEGKDDYGCANNDSVFVRVILPASITASPNDTLCMGENKQLKVSGAVTYKWSPSMFLDNDALDKPTFFARKDTVMNYTVTGFTEKNCFSDVKTISIKTYPIPSIKAISNDITLNVGSDILLGLQSSADVTTWTWQPTQGLSNPSASNPMAKPSQTTTYSCVASNGGGCVSRDEIVVHVICNNTNVFVPNTFSPNNDGQNDMFYPRGSGLFTIKSMRIFNRWGQLVFEGANITPNQVSGGWDGTYKGQPASSDVYVYTMDILCQNNSVIPVKGNVTLIR